MAYRNLDEFLTRLDQAGDVVHLIINHPDRTLPAISRRDADKVHLFTDEYGSRLVCNLFGTRQRIEQALRVTSLDLIAHRLDQLLEIGKPGGLSVMVSMAMTLFSAIRTTTNRRAFGEFQKHSFSDWWTTAPLTLNCEGSSSLYATLFTGGESPRMFAVSAELEMDRIVGKAWPSLELGERIVLVSGGDPACMIAANAPLPEFIHRSYFASWLREKPLDMMRLPEIDIEVPSNAEIVITATVSALNDANTVLNDISVWTRSQAIYPQLGRGELENIRDAFAVMMMPLMRRFLPGLNGLKIRGELGVLMVDPAKIDLTMILHQLWAVPMTASILYWLMLPDTMDVDAAVEQLSLTDIRSLSKLMHGDQPLGILLDAASKRELRKTSNLDLTLEQVFWHFKHHWPYGQQSGES